MCLKDNLGIWTLSLCLALVVSCSGGGSSETDSPVAPQVTPGTAEAQDVESGASGHYLWGYYMVSIDPESLEAEVVPVRQVTDHWNVLNWLEQGPCTTCLQITGITASDHGTTLVDVMIRHPFSNPNVTGFDVRGIAMFDGSREFPYAGLTSSDRTLGDGELVNTEGYTALYSADTAGWGKTMFTLFWSNVRSCSTGGSRQSGSPMESVSQRMKRLWKTVKKLHREYINPL